MIKSIFKIKKMDCPSEEQLIRMSLENISGIEKLLFNLPNRTLTILHTCDVNRIIENIDNLKLNSSLLSTSVVDDNFELTSFKETNETTERKLLIYVLLINFFFFILEIVFGLISKSMGLVADSLDMLADAFVYGLALWAVGSTIKRKQKVALTAGVLQTVLATLGMIEVIRRFIHFEFIPNFSIMIIISILALIGNTLSLIILQKTKSNEAHVKASKIFTSNDVIVNIGVIISAVLVYLTQSRYPDLVIGTIIFILVLYGAIRIFKLSKNNKQYQLK